MNFKKMTFLCMQKLTNFPYIEADFDALTNYELLCKVVEYLNKVIANENAQNEALNELATAFNNLKSYVDNYFDNLDVQEEINNKLDEMAESGELTDIIAQYLGLAGMIAYDTVADMKLAENLVIGSKCHTLGYNTKNDGGESLYFIREILNTDVVDEKKIIALYDQNLVAEIITPKEISPQIFGAIGDGVADDTSILSYILTNYNNLYLPTDKQYKISTINVPVKDVIINGNGKLIITGTGLQFNAPSNKKVIKDINIELTTGTVALQFNGLADLTTFNTLTIENLKIKTTSLSSKIGIYIKSEHEALISNTSLYGCSMKFGNTVNPSVVNCIIRHSDYGILYINEDAENPGYACGLKVLNTTILGCTVGIKSVQTDSLQVDNCMIDYDDYPIIILGTAVPIVDNSYISSRQGNEVIHVAKNNNDSGVFGGNGFTTEVTSDLKISNSQIIQHDESLTNSAVVMYDVNCAFLTNIVIPYSGKCGIELHDCIYTEINGASIRGSLTGRKAILSYKNGELGDDGSNKYSNIQTPSPIYVRYAVTDITTTTFKTKASGTVVVTAGTTSHSINTYIPQGVKYAIVTCDKNLGITYSTSGSNIIVTIPSSDVNFRLNWIAYGNETYSSF